MPMVFTTQDSIIELLTVWILKKPGDQDLHSFQSGCIPAQQDMVLT